MSKINNNQLNNIQIKKIKYFPNLSKQLFSKIEHLSWSMLLSSASSVHKNSRFDILVSLPKVKLETYSNITTVDTELTSYSTSSDPFKLISELQDLYLPNVSTEFQFPFIGGILGYFSYDLGRRIENISNFSEKDIDLPDMAVGFYEWAIIVDHRLKAAFVVGLNVDKYWQWISNQVKSSQSKFHLTEKWQSNMDKISYTNKFDKIQEYIFNGDCYQINLAQRFHTKCIGSEWEAYQRLEKLNLSPFSAFIRIKKGTIISLSPERFLEVNNGLIKTNPIKGTRPRSKDYNKDKNYALELINSEKDQAENLMIVDLLRNDLGRVAKPGTVHVPNLFFIESFPAVHHLVSTVTAKLDSKYSYIELLRSSFPGGSVTGAPKIRAMNIIEELEPNRRHIYCGSIGYISRNHKMDTNIAIRTLLIKDRKIYAWAGSGIVADSNRDSEYQETLDKLSQILKVL
ncbi:para-aminobenzoate synthase [Candidatus Photodesmus katoptron]|nr:para-aminobenzoate synthase [Candidatus Photodesmus katoptron]